jgi:hypothetical protein
LGKPSAGPQSEVLQITLLPPPSPTPAEPALLEPALCEPALLEPALWVPALFEPALFEPALFEPAMPSPALPGPSDKGKSLQSAKNAGVMTSEAKPRARSERRWVSMIEYLRLPRGTSSGQLWPSATHSVSRIHCPVQLARMRAAKGERGELAKKARAAARASATRPTAHKAKIVAASRSGCNSPRENCSRCFSTSWSASSFLPSFKALCTSARPRASTLSVEVDLPGDGAGGASDGNELGKAASPEGTAPIAPKAVALSPRGGGNEGREPALPGLDVLPGRAALGRGSSDFRGGAPVSALRVLSIPGAAGAAPEARLLRAPAARALALALGELTEFERLRESA